MHDPETSKREVRQLLLETIARTLEIERRIDDILNGEKKEKDGTSPTNVER